MNLHALKKYRFVGILLIAIVVAVVAMLRITDVTSASNWEATYWNNRNLSGNPELVRQETAIDHNWEALSPAPTVNVDNFSARWVSTINVDAPGVYRFSATADDGMRVWVDGQPIIDAWYESKEHTVTADVPLNPGPHSVRMEYFEAGGNASARLSWGFVGNAAPGAPGGNPGPGTGGPSHPGGAPIANWRGEYFNNTFFGGTPALVRDDPEINFNWGTGAPGPGVAMDQFSVRWTRNLDLSPGRYRFTVTTDDGMRLFVGNRLLIDKWQDQAATTYSAEIDLPGGSVPVRVDYYDNQGAAVAQVSWTRIGDTGGQPGTGGPMPPPVQNWRGEYYNNQALSGAPALVRDDANIDFNWGFGSPAPVIGADNFSVRWTRVVNLQPGRYQFIAATDDGVRVYVNNNLVIDAWSDHPVTTFTGEADLPGGPTSIRVDYYENTRLAEAHFSWRPVTAKPPSKPGGQPGTGGPYPTAVVTAAHLNVRSGPGVQFGPIARVHQGMEVSVLGRNGDATWAQIIIPDDGRGWVNAKYLNLSVPLSTLPDTSGPEAQLPTAHVLASSLNVRYGPGTQYASFLTVNRGQIVTVLGRTGDTGWVLVRLPSGTQGWVNARYLSGSEAFGNLPVLF